MIDEVLVHISTPATRQNDELFRSLANAYTAFQPYQVHRDESARKRKRIDHAASPDPDAYLTRGGKSVIRDPANSSVLTGSKESYGSFPSNLSSDERHQDQGSAQVDDDTMRPIGRLAQLDRSYLTWRKCATPKSSFTRSQREPQTSADGAEDADTGFIEDSQSALQALQSQLQDTYSTTSENTSEDEQCQDDNAGNAVEHSSRKLSPVLSQSGQLDGEVQLPAPVEDHVQADLGRSLSREPTDLSMHTTRASQSALDTISDRPDFSELPTDVFPCGPAISVACPGTLPSQITKHLAAIKTRNLSRFRPLKTRRNLDADERGYWHVDCTQWSPKIQQDFWSSLHEHVRSGRIGWGATLHRDPESGQTLGLVRLYCWGEVVEHMWLLLWLCSEGKLFNSRSKWIDANAVAVVEMQ
ncbi:hypothetical protein BU25DRAFT_411334 [Macroventuria anomochaeta]|uniref:Uncharacterized protein n=1 Tax=Macroventuria anomochaeta TaxID=301207 RepID=A0ACB6S077_9PLEO|nr:uncharacterized protein BU25DRAFT_411334 [Macroventuria anomochaeta]KAF2626804.1 hypothetical protein BU25DRAFT_411334 [Macroventuria anomochaeta]